MRSSSGTKYAVVMRNRTCRELEQRAEQQRDVALAGSGGAAHALHDGVPLLLLLGESIHGIVEEIQVRLGPVRQERGAETVHCGSVDPEVRVAPFVLVARIAGPLVGDSHAAGECDGLVDDEHLAVGPVIQPSRFQAGHRAEPPDRDPCFLHLLDQ